MALSPIEQRVKFIFEEKGLDQLQAKVNKVNVTLTKHSNIINKLSQAGTRLETSQNKTAKAVQKLRREFIAKGEDLLRVSGVTGNYRRALQGNEMALQKVKEAVRRYRVQQKKSNGVVLKAQAGIFGLTRNTRLLSISLAVLRSRILIAAFAFRALQQTVGAAVKAYGEQIDAEKRLENVLKTTQNAAGLSSATLVRYAKTLSMTARAGDEAIIAGMSLMATFTNISGDIFKEAIDISLDLSEVMGQDLKSSVVQVGKALDQPKRGLTALSRVGVSFSDEQRRLITNFDETNQKAKAQEVILQALRTQFGGARKNISDASKSFTQLSQAYGDFTEEVGRTLEPIVLPLVDGLTSILRSFDSDFNKTHSMLIKAGVEETEMNSILETMIRQKMMAAKLDNAEIFRATNLLNLNTHSAIGLANAYQHVTKAIVESKQGTEETSAMTTEAFKTLNKFGLASKEAVESIEIYKQAMDMTSDTTKNLDEATKDLFKDAFDIDGMSEADLGGLRMHFFNNLSSALSGAGAGIAATVSRSADGLKFLVRNGNEVLNLNTDLVASYANLSDSQKADVDFAFSQLEASEELSQSRENQIKVLEEFKTSLMELADVLGIELTLPKVDTDSKLTKFIKNNLKNVQLLSNAFGNLTSSMTAFLDAEMNALKKSDEFKNASTEKQQKMEEDLIKKQAEDRTRLAIMNKLQSMANAAINTASAVTQALPSIPLASLIGALGAAQVGIIAATPIPKFATGGLVGGRSHSQGGTMIEAERGEFVMSRRAVESVGIETMNRINQGGGQPVNISFTGNVMSQDFIEGEAIPMIKEAVRRGADIGVS